MRQHRTVLLIVTAVTAVTGACGNDTPPNAATRAEPTSAALGEGEYCKTARAWAVHELEPLAFEAFTCDAGQPPAADVDFSGEKSGAYCDAVAADKELFGAVKAAGLRPEEVREVVNSPEAKATAQELREAAPPSIKADVEAVTAWQQGQQREVLAANDYDMRTILLHGSAKERQALQLTDAATRTPFARTVAYEQQVCGG